MVMDEAKLCGESEDPAIPAIGWQSESADDLQSRALHLSFRDWPIALTITPCRCFAVDEQT